MIQFLGASPDPRSVAWIELHSQQKRCERREGLETDCGATLTKCSMDAVAKTAKQARARNKVLQFSQLEPSYVHDRESSANFS